MVITKVSSTQGPTPFEVCSVILNTINHVFIGTITIYFTYFCVIKGFNTEWILHIFLSTIGYQLLMAEGMLTFYTYNTWSNIFSKKTKTGLHISLQIAGSALAIAGYVVVFQARPVHFNKLHGILGFVSLVFLLITLVNSLAALFAKELNRIIKPVYCKLFHNICALAAFVIGTVSQIYGYDFDVIDDGSQQQQRIILGLTIGTSFTLVFSSIGSLSTIYEQIKRLIRR